MKREFYICGGAALIALGIISRSTKDIDLLLPKIDSDTREIAVSVGSKLGLSEGWINNGSDDILNYLEAGWKKRCSIVFEGTALDEELRRAQNWVVKCDASPLWEEIVEQCLLHIKEKLANG